MKSDNLLLKFALVFSLQLLFSTAAIATPEPSSTYPSSFKATPEAKALPSADLLNFKKQVEIEKTVKKAVKKQKRFVVPAYRVVFTTGKLLGKRSSAMLGLYLKGLDEEDLRTVVDAAYADLLAQMKTAGLEVVESESFRTTLGYKAIDFEEEAWSKEPVWAGDRGYKVLVTPTGLPLWFWYADTVFGQNPFKFKNMKNLTYFAMETEAVVVVPTIYVDFVTQEDKDLKNLESLKAVSDLKISDFNFMVGLVTDKKARGFKATGNVKLERKNEIPLGYLDKVELAQKSGSKWSGGEEKHYNAIVTPEEYREKVLPGFQSVNAAFIYALKEYQ